MHELNNNNKKKEEEKTNEIISVSLELKSKITRT